MSSAKTFSGLRRFVPACRPASHHDLERLQQFLNESKRLVALTGAGLSTESGIPDYRSANVGLYARTNRRPIQYLEFVRSTTARQRYWARNFVGWPKFSSFEPNTSHLALARWEKHGALDCIVTQNVDDLHRKAGSLNVVELHGSTHRVVCLSCDLQMSRHKLQEMFVKENPDWLESGLQDQIAPDGDVLLSDEQAKSFKVPPCPNCGGILKPDVIFFGDNVAVQLVDHIYGLVGSADSILVAGSSLFGFSGYRFVHRAKSLGKKIAIVNIGPTRADDMADLKIEARCSEVLVKLQV